MRRAHGDPRQADLAALPRRVVLLGASNVAKGLGTVVETAHRIWGRPLQLFAALGHGRSYGRASSVFGRQLPGIAECALWRDLAASEFGDTAALVTDIGNDLLYEEPVERIAAWIESCLDRLALAEARTVVTLLPVENLLTLSPARFRLMRAIFFPHSRISLAEVSARAHRLNERIERLAGARRFTAVSHRAAWYGLDPIHIRFQQRSHAWREILGAWSPAENIEPAGNLLARTIRLRAIAPERRRLWGFEQRAPQPRARLRDGTTVAMY
jgi:hypothetical protein